MRPAEEKVQSNEKQHFSLEKRPYVGGTILALFQDPQT